MCVQLGGEDTCEDLYKLFQPVVLTVVCDKTVSPSLRAKVGKLIQNEEETFIAFIYLQCCTCLGNITFLSGGDLGDVLLLMQQLESVFAGSYLKGDGNVANVTAEVAVLHSAAIHAWCLLFTLISPGSIGTMISTSKTLP